MNNGIVWLASYPKSGNTWFRIFLANLLRAEDAPVGINNLTTLGASSRDLVEEAVGYEISDMTADEIDRLRPAVYQHLADKAAETLFIKVHDAFTFVDAHTPLFPAAASRGAIYLIRNPLDVAVSYAHHANIGFKKTVDIMGRDTTTLSHRHDRLHPQLRQKLLSWSNHVLSWVDGPLPICLLRYEDMMYDPLATFRRAVRFIGLPHSDQDIQAALARSSFDRLQRQEDEEGFRERIITQGKFFRQGRAGGWSEELDPQEAEDIVKDHHRVMKRFGYIDEEDSIVFDVSRRSSSRCPKEQQPSTPIIP